MAQSPTPAGDDYQYDQDPSFYLQSFPLSHINKSHVENGNRIIMPSSAIHAVMTPRKIRCPMTFEITNLDSGKASHCGVLEFSAEDGRVYIPDWMMHTLDLKDGQFVKVEKTGNLAKATYMKIQPHSTDFVKNLSDPQVMLEEILKDFVCVTARDTIMVNHEDQRYYIDVVATDPEDVVSLFDTDCDLDVMQPLDYEEPPKQIKTEEGATELKELEADFAKFKPFTGVSRKLDENMSTNTTSVAKIDSNYLNEMTKLDAVIGSRNNDGTALSGQGDNEEQPEQIKTEEGKTELKEVEADFKKFKPFTGVSRKLDEKILTDTTSVAKSDSNYLNEMIKLDAVIGSRNYDGTAVSGRGDNEEPPEQIKTEEGATKLKELEADLAKFKPFTGASRKLDEKISTNTTYVVAKIDSNSLNEMSKLDAVICSQNYDGTAVSGQGDINGVGHKNEVKKFQPFTGRKYTLSGS